MTDWRILAFYVTILALVLLSGKPLWWLPCLSLMALLLSLPSRRRVHAFDWHEWHPVLATLVINPLTERLFRWVRYRKIIGGDSLMCVPTSEGNALILIDLSKNDLDTLLHFVWVRSVLAVLHGCPKGMLVRTLERLRQNSDRVEVTYLVVTVKGNDAEWQSAGCFGLTWHNGVVSQTRVLPTLGRTFWQTRRQGGVWSMTTDSVAPYLQAFVKSLAEDGSPERFVRSLPREDDLTVVWLLPALRLKPHRSANF